MLEKENEKRLEEILDMIANLAALDFSKELPVSGRNDMIDAIAVGLNMLGEELNSQVVARTRLDDLNEKLEKFAYTTAHDLKSPLNTQSGLLNLLEYSLTKEDNPEVREIIARLKSMNEKMKSLVIGILEYSKSSAIQLSKEPIDLGQLVEELLDTDDITKRAEVIIPEKLPVVLLNRTAGIQIFRNLLDNAIKYCDKERCEITITYKVDSELIEITVSDNGPGIDPKYHEQIFNLFEQADRETKRNGLGIGLATVKNIINVAGGTISLRSTPGEGANFTFTLQKP